LRRRWKGIGKKKADALKKCLAELTVYGMLQLILYITTGYVDVNIRVVDPDPDRIRIRIGSGSGSDSDSVTLWIRIRKKLT
jgi:hypothetical protein